MVGQHSCNTAAFVQDRERQESDGWKTRRRWRLMSISFVKRQRILNSCSGGCIPKSNYQKCHRAWIQWAIFDQLFGPSVSTLGSFHLELVQHAFGDRVRTKAPYGRLTVTGSVPVRDQPTSALLFVLNIRAGSSCGRWARCWSLQRRPPRPAALGSGWLRGAGGPAVSGRTCPRLMLPGWKGLDRQNTDDDDEGKRGRISNNTSKYCEEWQERGYLLPHCFFYIFLFTILCPPFQMSAILPNWT